MSTISFPNMFNINRNTMTTQISYGVQSISESLKSLLSTNPGELLGDPQYGCGMRLKLFDIKSDINITELRNIIYESIKKYIPQIIVNHTDIQFYSNPDNNKYKITIAYKILKINESQFFEMVL